MDSGAESCTEDKLRTAQVFMTGIQSAILSSTSPDTGGGQADTGEDIVSEVNNIIIFPYNIIIFPINNISCFPPGGERPVQADGLTAERFVAAEKMIF